LISDPETNPELFQDLKQKMDPQAHLKSKGSESSALISHSACNVTFFDVANSQQNLGKNMKHHAKIPQKNGKLMGALRSKPHSSISRNFAWPSASKRVSKFHGQHGRNPDIHEIAKKITKKSPNIFPRI